VHRNLGRRPPFSVAWVAVAATFLVLGGSGTPGFGQSRGSAGSRSPHGNLNIPCQNCHTSVSWKPIRAVPEFDHNKTRYPLRGLHEGVACTQCHAKPVFSNTGTNCADCHADIHRRQMGANCEQCHTVKGWSLVLQRVREHDNRFPLIGGHAGLDCADCHKSEAVGQFQGLSIQCYSCHQNTYQQTNAPSHVASGFPIQCEQCHTINSWLGAKFDHLKFTGFALTGTHATLDCTACHAGGRYKGTPAACVGCHLPDFQRANNPNHVALGLPQTCQECHTTSAWQPASFNHDAVGFPLTGGHAKLQCDQCHKGNYNLTTATCVSCHLTDYQGTKSPNHISSGFPQQCEVCHSTSGWTPATFDHSKTGWALTGLHAPVACTLCHTNNNYSLTTTACVACHLKEYQATTSPNHVSVGFPQQCDVCHTTAGWTLATFNHNNTSFPLTGAHTTVACANCHVNNNYTTLPTDCYSCHKAEYQGASNPNHAAAGFPTTCGTCHTTAAWMPATFNHNALTPFPIDHGHNAANGVCSVCHTNPSDYSVFQCTDCHEHGGGNANNFHHPNVGGYVYNSVNCYQCHRNGGGG
jgi:NMD protein affecting ribosome stability and mRNA decay